MEMKDLIDDDEKLHPRGILPMLRTLHKFPMMMNQMICDKGAIRHIFSGSHVMAPGLTSEGGTICKGCAQDSPVAVMAEGKKHAMAIGFLNQSSEQMVETKKGQAIEIIQFLNDSLWKDIQ